MARVDDRGFISLAIFIVVAYGVLEVSTIEHERAARSSADLGERAAVNLLRFHRMALESGITDGGFAALGPWLGVSGELLGHDVVDLRLTLANRYRSMDLGYKCADTRDVMDPAVARYEPQIDAPGVGGDWKEEVARRIDSTGVLRLRVKRSMEEVAGVPGLGGGPAPPQAEYVEPVLTLAERELRPFRVFNSTVGYNVGCCDLEMPDTKADYTIDLGRLAAYARAAGRACGNAAPLCAAMEFGMCPLSDHVTLGPYGIPRAHSFNAFGTDPADPKDTEAVRRVVARALGLYQRDTCSLVTTLNNKIPPFFALDPVSGLTYPRTWLGFKFGPPQKSPEDTVVGVCSPNSMFTDPDRLRSLELCYPCAYSTNGVLANDDTTWKNAEGVVLRGTCRLHTVVERGMQGIFPYVLDAAGQPIAVTGRLELLGKDGALVSSLPVHMGVDAAFEPAAQRKCDFNLASFDVWAFYDVACRMAQGAVDPAAVPLVNGNALLAVLSEDVRGKVGIHEFAASMHKWATDAAYQAAGYSALTRCPGSDACLLRVLGAYPLVRRSMTCDGKRCCP